MGEVLIDYCDRMRTADIGRLAALMAHLWQRCLPLYRGVAIKHLSDEHIREHTNEAYWIGVVCRANADVRTTREVLHIEGWFRGLVGCGWAALERAEWAAWAPGLGNGLIGRAMRLRRCSGRRHLFILVDSGTFTCGECRVRVDCEEVASVIGRMSRGLW